MAEFPRLKAENIEAVLSKLQDEYIECAGKTIPESVKDFDKSLEDAMRADVLSLYERVLSFVGQCAPHGKPNGFKDISVCSVLGYASYSRAYYAPVTENHTRQARRAKARRKAKEGKSERRKRNGVYLRKGEAPCAFPIDRVMGVVDGLTAGMQERMQRSASITGSFAEGASVLKLYTGVNMSTSTFRRKALFAGERAVEAQEFPLLRLLNPYLPAWLITTTIAVIPTLYIMMDGTGVPCVRKDTEGVRGKGVDGKAGTRELKVGIVGTYRRLNNKGQPVRDPLCESHIVSRKTASEFGTLLRKLAFSRGLGTNFRVQIVGDGAEWIANIVKIAFPGKDVIFTNDFYHACEYLHEAITLAENDVQNIAKVYKTAKSILFRFGGGSLMKHMRKRYATLDETHGVWEKLKYIDERREHMKYGEYRKQGLFVGSGLIESACRTDVARRCKQSGMHWRLENAESMCALVARFRSNLRVV